MVEIDGVKEAAQRWLSLDQNPKSRDEVQSLLQQEDWTQLEDIMCQPLKFGTAGLRAQMRAGFSCMNELTVIQASQGLAMYLLESTAAEDSDGGSGGDAQHMLSVRRQGVVIGFDYRHNSRKFAQLTAAVFKHASFKVYLFDDAVPTPFVSYGVKQLQAAAGVMITASHNPAQDNGYKVYWSNACQIQSAHSDRIEKIIQEYQSPWLFSTKALEVEDGLLSLLPPMNQENDHNQSNKQTEDSIIQKYYKEIKELLYFKHNSNDEQKSAKDFSCVYTSLHGVGLEYARRVFNDILGLNNVHYVTEQCKPDGDFPTLKYPNPEDAANAFRLSVQLADQVGARVVFANDPDADRLAMAFKNRDGCWVYPTGDQISVLLLMFIVQHLDSGSGDQALPDKRAIVTSYVSSGIFQKIAQSRGIHLAVAETGFKNIGNRALKLQQEGYQVLFACEEALGYSPMNIIPEKDGISSLLLLVQLMMELHNQDKTVDECFESYYGQFGYHKQVNFSYKVAQNLQLASIVDHVHNQLLLNEKSSDLGGFKLKSKDQISVSDDNTCIQRSKKMFCTQLYHQDSGIEARLIIRKSGTEPKVKLYLELCGSQRKEVDEAAEILQYKLRDMLKLQLKK
ncbi:hypothetical protein MP228_011312 [Amoeboaphelidium protococcarum]|nr:hypothetical protein MP228_011312 [Amoeboaphelidium protococcarum]